MEFHSVPDSAKDGKKPDSAARSAVTYPVVVAGALTVATLVGFAYLFSVWASSSEISAEDKLRLAAAQYVAGNPEVAGDLAAQVMLPNDPAVNQPKQGEGVEGDGPEPPPEIPEGEEPAENVPVDGSLVESEEEQEEDKWLPLQKFLVGAGIFHEATGLDLPSDRREKLKNAVPFLEMAKELGFPDGRDADGYRMLGIAHQELGDYEKATKYLQAAIDRDLTLKSELTQLLAISSAKRPGQDLNEAIAAIEQVLATQSLDIRKRTDTELLKVKWLLKLGRFAEAERVIQNARERIAPDVKSQERWALNAADALLLAHAEKVVKETLAGIRRSPGESMVAGVPSNAHMQVDEDKQEELLDMIRGLVVLQRESTPKLAANSRLTAAQAHLLAGQPNLALAEFTQVRQQRPFSDEGLEGGLSEMELLAEDSLGTETLQTSRYLVREILQSRHLNFTNSKENEFRNRVKNTLARLRTEGQYQAVIDIAEAVTPLFGVAEASIEKAIGYRDWGEANLADGRGAGGEISREAFEMARARFRGAGDAFSIAAKEQFNSKDYVPTLWSSIDAYQRGRHFSKSIGLLEKYLRYEERMRQPQGLVAHGRALLAEGQPEAAMRSLQTCIAEFERDPMRYEARLLAAQAAADSKDVEQAKVLLQENLKDGKLTPQSPVWRDSLHTLGELLYAECDLAILAADKMKLTDKIQQFREIEPKLALALRRLNEAVQRYRSSPRSQQARYLFARGQLLAARLPEAEIQVESLLDAAKRDLRQKINRYHQTALDQFTELARLLDRQEREAELSEKQEAILRNSLLGQADTLKAMRRYIESADAYRDMALRYINEPPALEALLGQARMVRLLGRGREADLLLTQASVVLSRIPDTWDDRFEEMTRFDRDGWTRYLEWVSQGKM